MAKINDDVINVLKRCTIKNSIISLPDEQLDRKLYMDVKKQFELIGGKWKSGKIQGFVFDHEPDELLKEITAGTARNLKKEFQFFETPAPLAKRLVELAGIKDGDTVLEPSAGQGAIIQAIYEAFPRTMTGPNDRPCVTVDYLELMDINRMVLDKNIFKNKNWHERTSYMGDDFLAFTPPGQLYNKIVANPPFSKNQDIDHIDKMYKCLRPGGRIVTIASMHWYFSSGRKETAFREWLKMLGCFEPIRLDAGEFNKSGTNVFACILVINKPLNH